MNAKDVMTTDVVTAGPNAGVAEVAQLLLARGISGIPVVGEQGELVGIVSEGDLMRRAEAGTEFRRPWWLEWLKAGEGLASDYIKAHAKTVKEVMTQQVVTVAPDTPVGEIARLLERHRIKRVPVVKDGKILGIVSRANLLQALASLARKAPEPAGGDDSAIRERITARLKAEPWARALLLNVTVHEGVVDLWGFVDSPA